MEALKDIQAKEDRKAKVAAIAAACLKLRIGETERYSVQDLQTYQSVKTKLSRLKKNSSPPLIFEVSLEGNAVVVTRKQ